jgi:hypothetical protein
MKKLILALLAAGTVATANAQEPKSILLYGNLGLHTTRADNLEKTTIWNVTPGIGYQFNHNWTLGLNISWGQNAFKDANAVNTTRNMYAVGPFARYSSYIHRSEIFFWYAQADVSYTGGYTTNEGNPAVAKHTGLAVNVYPALGINVGHDVCLNFMIGGLAYGTDKFTDAPYSTNTFDLTFGQMWNIGISKNFGCGHKMHSHHEPGDEIHRRKLDKMEDEDDAAPMPKRKQRNRDEDE